MMSDYVIEKKKKQTNVQINKEWFVVFPSLRHTFKKKKTFWSATLTRFPLCEITTELREQRDNDVDDDRHCARRSTIDLYHFQQSCSFAYQA